MDPRPCVNVDDLLAWEPPGGAVRAEIFVTADDRDLPRNPIGVPPIEELRPGPMHKRLPQLMVIHDYKGDFPICERWDGCLVSDCEPFLFTHWWHMDTFCYYGRKMVTIPPPAFTSIAHLHGVRVLGTILFKGDHGEDQLLSRILSNEESVDRTVDKLVQIMKTWRFDGWLVKVETKVLVSVNKKKDTVTLLKRFLSNLTSRTEEVKAGSRVWMYDALPAPTEYLPWHRTINRFQWKVFAWSNEPTTRDVAINVTLDKLFDKVRAKYILGSVCIGLDVHGNTKPPTNTGWGSHMGVREVLKRTGLSVALFAPGWAVEKKIGDNPEDNSEKFWTLLSPRMNTRVLDYAPFKTTFRNGYSQNGKFFRLCDMDLMPHLAHSKGLLIPSERGLKIKKEGKHLLWVVKNMRSHRDLRVKIRVEGPGSVTIALDRREMRTVRIDEDGNTVLRPQTGECLPVRAISMVASHPWSVLSYFEVYNVETERCLE